ncbi:effector-associated constant component EACC1 [Streptomyces sp. NBC_00690]|uniref:effector-associated constant component EACC1 n=1 Tax=Streptomyces sp. NBC_00690 TaxID=2975808 RepID=UPI002E2CCDF7|nr:hypothetical protein [Streptomyces sp. NBC_00690]
MVDSRGTEVELRLAIVGADAETHLPALREWLTLEDALRGRVELIRSAPQPGQMGTTLDLLAVALGSGGAGAVLVQALTTWLTQRRADITVTVFSRDGRQVTVDVKRAAQPDRVLAEVRELLGPEGAEVRELPGSVGE